MRNGGFVGLYISNDVWRGLGYQLAAREAWESMRYADNHPEASHLQITGFELVGTIFAGYRPDGVFVLSMDLADLQAPVGAEEA